MFDQFKATLVKAVSDEDFRRKNSVFQDADYLADLADRIQALTPDISIVQNYKDVISVLGMIEQDTKNSRMRFATRGFETTLSAFREGKVTAPCKIWYRNVAGSSDRYLVVDHNHGVLVLNDAVEVLYRFPHFGPNISGNDEYSDPSACCTFTSGSSEYIAITLFSHHVCMIYKYGSPNTFMARIGTVDTPGATAGQLNNPVGVAVDSTNERMYIACQVGQPTGATLNRGFISTYDISDPTLPVWISTDFYYKNSGSVLDLEIDAPTDILLDGTLLWISNGNDEVAAIETAGGVYRCAKYIEPTGRGYTLRSPQQLFVSSTLGGYRYLFIANGANGTVEEFDQLTLRHRNTYGYRASEDELNAYDRLSDSIYGAVGYAHGVVADRVVIDGKETDVLICADSLNKRLHRFNLAAYTEDNFANFALLEFEIPISVNGWTISGDIPIDMVKVYYRFQETDEFHELPQETTLPSTTTLQLRVAVQLDSKTFIKSWYIRHLRINGTQT